MSDAVVKALSELIPCGAARGELDRGGRALRWIEAGSGSPTVVLDAASGTPALTWAPLLPELARHVRVIAYDRAGLGLSDPAPQLTAGSAVADLIALLTKAGRGPCILVGNSWGGQLVQQVAWTAPELVAGLVLVDPAHEEFEPWFERDLPYRRVVVPFPT
ncbi:alpha/beta fold hydrolase [Streptomyces globisporus]|uniref:alpha/beta fold hydrolase n=1 Tax=Streptomyces globisporus TaxID=1908 RepID=UPI0037BC1F0B